MSTLVLLRHGQASFGADRYDTLSGLGRQQAEAVGRHLSTRERGFSRVWVGPRDRHRLSARYALEPLGIDWQTPAEPALDEFAEGQQILASAERVQGVKLLGHAAITGVEARRRYAAQIDAWAAGKVEIEGVVSARNFRLSVVAWLHHVWADPTSGQNLLAVTSAGVIAAVLTEVLGQPDSALADYMSVLHNSSLTRLAFSPGRRPGLMSFNETGFLTTDLLTRL
ncbi:MAG: histidine phosphatase family protein [Panacagrimonas sp.]